MREEDRRRRRQFTDHLDYIIILIAAIIAVLVLMLVQTNVNVHGQASLNQIDDFDSQPLANCNIESPQNIVETASSNPYITTIVYFNKCYPQCLKITTIENRISNEEAACGR